MFSKLIVVAALCCATTVAIGQTKDSLFVNLTEGDRLVAHKVMPGENVVSIAHNFHVPPSVLANTNGISPNATTLTKSSINIPIGEYNELKSRPAKTVSARTLFYRCKKGDNVFRLSTRLGVTQDALTNMNNLQSNNFYEKQVLVIGWVLYDANPLGTDASNNNSHLLGTDSMTADQRTYLSQTGNEANVTEEKGTAVFYAGVGKPNGPYYAFHNGTSRGTIVKVFNPGNGKAIYVKVIGPLPGTKQYYNATIGINSNAKDALGVTDSRAWCELKFAAN